MSDVYAVELLWEVGEVYEVRFDVDVAMDVFGAYVDDDLVDWVDGVDDITVDEWAIDYGYSYGAGWFVDAGGFVVGAFELDDWDGFDVDGDYFGAVSGDVVVGLIDWFLYCVVDDEVGADVGNDDPAVAFVRLWSFFRGRGEVVEVDVCVSSDGVDERDDDDLVDAFGGDGVFLVD